MPDYTTMAKMNALIPHAFLIQALDDDKDGVADATAWSDVLGSVQTEIDGLLSVRFTTPFANPVPAIVLTAAEVLAGELLYNRRGVSGEDKNPWAKRAKDIRAMLQKIAAGDLPLTPETKRPNPAGSIISEKAKTTSATGKLSA